MSSFTEKIKPWYGSIAILPFVIFYTIKAGEFTFIDYINLLIHEGGHGIFRIFGEYIYFMGGTLMQLIIPGLFIYFFWRNEKRIGLQFSMVWLGESMMNVSVYAADARAQKLPLLGGSKVQHDWHYLLGQIGMLEYDTIIGGIFFYSGIAVFILALLIPLIWKDYEKVKLELKL